MASVGERFRRLLFARRNLLPKLGKALTHCRHIYKRSLHHADQSMVCVHD